MENIEDESLISALSHCCLKELPEEDDNESIWIKAIALVTKTDGSKSYIYVVRDDNDSQRVVADFGTSSAISNIEKYYPFAYLKECYMPYFKTKKKDEFIEYLKKYSDKDFSKMTIAQLKNEVVRNAINLQKEAESEIQNRVNYGE